MTAHGRAIRAPWRALTPETAGAAPGAVGVFELRRAARTVLIGYAGGRTRFGLRGVLAELAVEQPGGEVRFEVTTAYLSRWRELLGWHLARTGALPAGNSEVVGVRPIGRVMSR